MKPTPSELFKALVVAPSEGGRYVSEVKDQTVSDLPPGDVLIKVIYSSLNYKDALSSVGNKGVTQKYPHIPGIDAAGYVVSSEDENFEEGQAVIVTGFDLGMNTFGGFSSYIRVPASWIIPCPKELSLKTTMIWGTAGLTAALSVKGLLDHGLKAGDSVFVSGASGGVGSLSVGILSHLGFEVIAATGKGKDAHDKLKNLGAHRVVGRDIFDMEGDAPLVKGAYHGVLDTVGGSLLAQLLKRIRYGGVATCCGMAASPKLETTVFPFILRGIKLIGIDSVQASLEDRHQMWNYLAKRWSFPELETLHTIISLAQLPQAFDDILRSQITGRVVVSL